MKWVFALSIFAAACGGDKLHHLPDAPPSIDALSADAGPPPPVTVTITNNGAPQAGVTAIFTNADSSPVATLQTDATGTASQAMAAGGFVTAVVPVPILPGFVPATPPYDLYTWAGVKPGDRLVFDESVQPPTQLSFTLITPVVANATSYSVSLLCGNLGGYGSLTPPDGSDTLLPTGTVIAPGCTTADVIVGAYASGTLLATLYHPALAFAEDQTVDLSATDTYVAAVSATYTYANVPSTSVSAQFTLVSTNVLFEASANSAVDGGSATFAAPQPATGSLSAFVDSGYTDGQNSHDVVDWGVANGNYTLDFTSQSLPDVGAPSFDYATDQLTWTAGSGAPPDLVLASLLFSGDPNAHQWTIAAPYAAGSLQLPLLAGYMPASTDTLQINELETAQLPGGYDAVRDYALAADDYFFVADGATGRALLESYNSEVSSVARRR
jgi:hypothetical protein